MKIKWVILKVEIEKIITPVFFENKKILACIVSSMNLIKVLTVENQSNYNVYNLINNFFNFLNKKNWINMFIFWELELLKSLGYDLELQKIVNEEIIDGKKLYFVSNNSEKKYVPSFLVENNNEEIEDIQIYNGLKLVSDYLDKSILKPNNISQPKSRVEFINLLKE